MTTFLTIRVLHIVFAAIWFGAALSMIFFVIPSLRQTKPGGAEVMTEMMRRKYPVFMESIAGLTVLTGLYLYWHFTEGFDPTVSASMAGRVFGAGGAAGIVALILGGSVVGRSMKQISRALQQASTMNDGPEKTALFLRVATLQQRADITGRVILLLMLIAIVTMSIGHYV